MKKKLIVTAWLLSLGLLGCSTHSPAPVELRRPESLGAEGTRGMVSTAHPIATRAGLEMLGRGGNAFDAAVVIASTLNVVEPMMSGLGGYGTILVYDAREAKAHYLDASGKIPAAVDPDVYRAPTPDHMENRRNAKAVSTPGAANAWQALSDRFGSRPWSDLLQPAIRVADEGFVIDDQTAGFIARAFDEFPAHARAFYGKEGRPLATGERLIQKDLAGSLRRLADEGAAAVHGGTLGRAIHEEMAAAGGFLQISDLANDRAEWWEPIRVSYRGYEVVTPSAPAGAFPMLVRLGMMSLVDVKELGHNSLEYLHHFAEVTKRAYWMRLAFSGDPDVEPPPYRRLLSPEHWVQESAKIDSERAWDFDYHGILEAQSENTTHFVVADQWGNVVSATVTLGNLFGSRRMAKGTGIWLNNSLAYCTFEPKGNPMDAHPGRRKLSSDSPAFVLKEGRPWVAIGTPGGHTITQAVAQMIMNMVDFEMDIGGAIAAPRIAFIEPDRLVVEAGIPVTIRDQLAARGHNLAVGTIGNAHGLTIEYDTSAKPVRFQGAPDPRGRGTALGLHDPEVTDQGQHQ